MLTDGLFPPPIWEALELIEATWFRSAKITKRELLDLVDQLYSLLLAQAEEDELGVGPLDLDEATGLPCRLIGSHRFRKRLGRN
jgi:hypothetical protein